MQIPIKRENSVEVNTELAELFDKLEIYSKQKPDAFAFFCKKYEQILYDNFDWAYALFHTDEKPVGMFDKIMPYLNMLLGIVIIILLVKK